jgi:hypothetical protein
VWVYDGLTSAPLCQDRCRLLFEESCTVRGDSIGLGCMTDEDRSPRIERSPDGPQGGAAPRIDHGIGPGDAPDPLGSGAIRTWTPVGPVSLNPGNPSVQEGCNSNKDTWLTRQLP